MPSYKVRYEIKDEATVNYLTADDDDDARSRVLQTLTIEDRVNATNIVVELDESKPMRSFEPSIINTSVEMGTTRGETVTVVGSSGYARVRTDEGKYYAAKAVIVPVQPAGLFASEDQLREAIKKQEAVDDLARDSQKLVN